ncbi:hypothetical protein CAEBREN_05137 [Caenorhabditis brenneri]|uniref:Uncharacterized protein n=1 Tax=Caenorhabditis brenneri TaxID=135651 RepID=G0MDQ8_CAEBE|nr:hypothetical protein CAEBREN_05137 [Caenorhabditis brenneri]
MKTGIDSKISRDRNDEQYEAVMTSPPSYSELITELPTERPNKKSYFPLTVKNLIIILLLTTTIIFLAASFALLPVKKCIDTVLSAADEKHNKTGCKIPDISLDPRVFFGRNNSSSSNTTAVGISFPGMSQQVNVIDVQDEAEISDGKVWIRDAPIVTTEDSKKKVEEALTMTKNILKLGASIEPLKTVLGPIAALGNLVSSIFSMRDRPDPVMEMLKGLETKMDEKLMSLLEHYNSNPLLQAMSADSMKRASTFNKWKDIIGGVMVRFLYIETYASGMFNGSSTYGSDRLIDKIHEFNNLTEKWSNNYKNSYFPSAVLAAIQHVQDTSPHGSHQDKAQVIDYFLNEILQPDGYVYMIVVYKTRKGQWDHFGFGGSDYVESNDRGYCNAVVLRTRESNSGNRNVNFALYGREPLRRNQKLHKNRCRNLVNSARDINYQATANGFIYEGNEAIMFTKGKAPAGHFTYGWKTTWVATY